MENNKKDINKIIDNILLESINEFLNFDGRSNLEEAYSTLFNNFTDGNSNNINGRCGGYNYTPSHQNYANINDSNRGHESNDDFEDVVYSLIDILQRCKKIVTILAGSQTASQPQQQPLPEATIYAKVVNMVLEKYGEKYLNEMLNPNELERIIGQASPQELHNFFNNNRQAMGRIRQVLGGNGNSNGGSSNGYIGAPDDEFWGSIYENLLYITKAFYNILNNIKKYKGFLNFSKIKGSNGENITNKLNDDVQKVVDKIYVPLVKRFRAQDEKGTLRFVGMLEKQINDIVQEITNDGLSNGSGSQTP